MNKRLLGVDVDLTVVASDKGWAEWLVQQGSDEEVVDFFFKHKEVTPYALGSLFPSIGDPYNYWRTLDYNVFRPLPEAVKKLELLSEYFGIVFISQPKGNHSKSKFYWLKENFPFMEGYIATKEKFLMGNSLVAMIDDRLDVLGKFESHKRVLFKTPYTQNAACSTAYEINNWIDFETKEFCDLFL